MSTVLNKLSGMHSTAENLYQTNVKTLSRGTLKCRSWRGKLTILVH
jgi:hypothetical protein